MAALVPISDCPAEQYRANMLSSRQMPTGARILIVDDDPEMQHLLQEMLGCEAYDVRSASGGEEALARLRREEYDLVLAETEMRGMDGLTLLTRIHDMMPAAKVVVMTAQSTPDTVIRAIRNNAYTYLRKPFSRPSLIETVNAALSVPVEPDDIEVISADPHWISLQVRCKISIADRLARFFRELGGELSAEDRDCLAISFRELLINAIEHGAHSDPKQKVNISYIRTYRSIIYYIRDPGDGFSFDKLPHAAVSNRPGEPLGHTEIRDQMGIRPGGFGILLTKNFADELIYSEKGNEVILIKYLPETTLENTNSRASH